MLTDRPNDDVSVEMERIFKPLSGRSPAVPLDHGRLERVGREPARTSRRTIALAAPVLVLFVGAAMAISYAGAERAGSPRIRTGTNASVSEISVPPSSRSPTPRSPVPGSVELVSASAPVDLAPPEEDRRELTTERSRKVEDAARGPAHDGAGRTVERSAAMPPNRDAWPLPRATKPLILDADFSRRLDRGGEPASIDTRCEPDSKDDHCIYQDVLNADDRLRRAYDLAERGGVSRAWLSAVARRWQRARDNADYDPDGTIQRYGQLADALDRKRSEETR